MPENKTEANKSSVDSQAQKQQVVKNNGKPITVKLEHSQNVKVEFIDDSEEPYFLTNDDGTQEEFIGIAGIEYYGVFYVILKPVNPIQDMADDEALLFRIEPEDEDNDMYIPVEDEGLADKIFEEYLKALDDLEDMDE